MRIPKLAPAKTMIGTHTTTASNLIIAPILASNTIGNEWRSLMIDDRISLGLSKVLHKSRQRSATFSPGITREDTDSDYAQVPPLPERFERRRRMIGYCGSRKG